MIIGLLIYFITLLINYVFVRFGDIIDIKRSAKTFLLYLGLSPLTVLYTIPFLIMREYYAEIYNASKIEDEAGFDMEEANEAVAQIIFDTAEAEGYPLATFEDAYKILDAMYELDTTRVFNLSAVFEDLVTSGRLVEADGIWSMKN